MLIPFLLDVGAPCIFIGDEIAQAVAAYKPECAISARPGASTMTLQKIKLNHTYPKVIISIGTNGYLNPNIGPNLFTIRKKFKNASVVWLAPRNSRAQEAVFETAVHFHDRVVYLNKTRPTGVLRAKDYKAIAKLL
jgi:hypothetical protein